MLELPLCGGGGVAIGEDMPLSLCERAKDGREGPEIAAAGFPLRPEIFCGRGG